MKLFIRQSPHFSGLDLEMCKYTEMQKLKTLVQKLASLSKLLKQGTKLRNKLIYENIIAESNYPRQWQMAYAVNCSIISACVKT